MADKVFRNGRLFTKVPTAEARRRVSAGRAIGEESESEWWQVVTLPGGEQLMMDNSSGQMLILTLEEESFFCYI